MKIYIKKTIQIPEIPTEVEMESGTLRDLLDTLLRHTYFVKEVIDPATGELSLDGLFRVTLNGTAYHTLPDGIDTKLHDQDTVTLTLVLIGGG
jgi:ferric-dicitrate binding protein FerR (iron transport regulator)